MTDPKFKMERLENPSPRWRCGLANCKMVAIYRITVPKVSNCSGNPWRVTYHCSKHAHEEQARHANLEAD
jgi:hypothetical protein